MRLRRLQPLFILFRLVTLPFFEIGTGNVIETIIIVASSVALSSDVFFANRKILSILSLFYNRLFDGKPIIEPKSDYFAIIEGKTQKILPDMSILNCKLSNIT
jgi:hypothetical protein